jgi:uncharacterized repeat protein (TIGR01451 family)
LTEEKVWWRFWGNVEMKSKCSVWLGLTLALSLVLIASRATAAKAPTSTRHPLGAQPKFYAAGIHQTTGPVYGLASGEFDSLHDGTEVAVLLSDGSVLQLSPNPSGWTAARRYAGEINIADMRDRPTIAIGDVHSGYAGNEIITEGDTKMTMVFDDPGAGWSHEVLTDSALFLGGGWGARVGDCDPIHSGDEIFYIYESVLDFSVGMLFRESDSAWENEIIYSAEVGMDSACGDFNPEHAGSEIVVVTEMGPAYEIIPPQDGTISEWPRRTIWDDLYNAGWVAKIADVAPDNPGNEIVYGTRYSNRIMMSQSNGSDPHDLQILFTGDAADEPRSMWDIAIGDVLPDADGLEILGVDETGSVYLVQRVGDSWQGQVIWQDGGASLYSVVAGDFLPGQPGDEILVAGESGAITLLSLAPIAALSLTKQASPDPVLAGSPLTYTIRVTNTGNVDLHATVTDTLPTHIMPGKTSNGTLILPGGVITWTPIITSTGVGTSGDVWTQTIVVTVERGYAGPLTNVVRVSTAEGVMGLYTETSQILTPLYLPLVLLCNRS